MGVLSALTGGLGGFFFIGDNNPIYNVPGRPLIDLFSGLLLIIGLVVGFRYWRQPRFTLPVIMTVVLLLPAIVTKSSPDWLHFAVLLPLVALYFGVGVNTIYHSLPRPARSVVPVGLVGIIVFNVVWVSGDIFDRWRDLPEAQHAYHGRLARLARHLDLTAASVASTVCTQRLRINGETGALTHSEMLTLMMHRQNASVRYANCGSGIVLTNGGESEQVILPRLDTLARTNEYIHDWLMEGDFSSAPSLPEESVILLNVEDRLGKLLKDFESTSIVSYAPEAPGGMSATFPAVRFGGNITFLGYEPLETEPFAPGDYVTLVTYWRVDGVVPSDLRLFTHLLLDPEQPAAQSDTISVLPGQLQPRDVFIQISFVRIPAGLPDGAYALSVGAYEDTSDIRLHVFDAENQPRGTRLFLGEIIVAG
jgi:hypothetical protein